MPTSAAVPTAVAASAVPTAAAVPTAVAVPVAVPTSAARVPSDLARIARIAWFEQDRLDKEAEVLGLVTDPEPHHSDFMSDRAVDVMDDIHSTITHEIGINEPRFWFI